MFRKVLSQIFRGKVFKDKQWLDANYGFYFRGKHYAVITSHYVSNEKKVTMESHIVKMPGSEVVYRYEKEVAFLVAELSKQKTKSLPVVLSDECIQTFVKELK